MERLEVIVIGAGPAGSIAGRTLKAFTDDFVVLDKAVFPRFKCCAGWLTNKAIEEADIDLDEYKRHHVLQRLNSLVVWSPDSGFIEYPARDGWGVLRREFDHYMASRLGGHLRQGYMVKDLRFEPDRVIINNEFEAAVVIDASGHASVVSKGLNKVKGTSSTIAAVCTEGELSKSALGWANKWAGRTHIVFTPKLDGYGWMFVKGNVLNLGMGVLGGVGSDVRRHFVWMVDILIKNNRLDRTILDALPPLHGHFYELYTSSRRPLVYKRAILSGDATGVALDGSGEGIGPSMLSGRLAAEVAMGALYSHRSMEFMKTQYEMAIETYFGRRSTSNILSRVLSVIAEPISRVILSSPVITQQLVVRGWFGA